MNFQLKDDRSGGSLVLRTGGHRAGDGRAWTVAGNAGLPLGETGFANLGVEYGGAGATSRSVQRGDARGWNAPAATAASTPPNAASSSATAPLDLESRGRAVPRRCRNRPVIVCPVLRGTSVVSW